MYRRIVTAAAILAVITLSITACSSDGDGEDWKLDDELDAGDAADVAHDTVDAERDARPDIQSDVSPDADTGHVPDLPRCPTTENAFPAETLPAAELPDPLGEVPRTIWSWPMENHDGNSAVPNGPLAVSRGMYHDKESVDVVVAPGFIEAVGEEPAWVYTFEVDADTGESLGGGGSGVNYDERYESQAHGLPAPLLFPGEDLFVGFSVSQSTDSASSTASPGTLTIRLDSNYGSDSTGYDAPSRGTMPLLSDAVMFPRGRALLLWDERAVVALPRRLFEASRDSFPHPPYRDWIVDLDDLWLNAPEGTELTWMKSPSADEALVLARHTPPEGSDVEPQPDRLYRIDPCSYFDEVFSGVGIADELLKVGEQYLIRIGSREESAAGSTPVLVADGEIQASLDVNCRDIVQTDADRFACLSKKDDGTFHVVRFDDALEQTSSEPLDSGYSYARLSSAADNGALVLLAMREQDDQTPVVDLVLASSDDAVTYELPEVQDWEPTTDDVDKAWPVLTQRGVVALMWGTSLLGVQTSLPGLARTAYPRAYYGGNRNRGFVDVGE